MAYNPYFPMNYQQPYIPQYQQPAQQGITWVQGKAGALAVNCPAGQSMVLLDSEAPFAYKKETDVTGKPLPLETYRLVKEDEKPVEKQQDMTKYVKADEIENIISDRITDIVRDEVERRLSEFTFKPTNRRSKNTED